MGMAICGIVTMDGVSEGVEAQIEAMLSAMNVGPKHAHAQLHEETIAMGAGPVTKTVTLCRSAHVLVACDAQLYNVKDLWNGFAGKSSESVAGLIAELYLAYGDKFIEKLEGVFAIVIWDARARNLILARDRFGVKALSFSEVKGALFFASYPSGVVANRSAVRKVNLSAIADYLNFSVVPAPKAAYEGVVKLRPGELVIWHAGQITKSSYWKIKYTEKSEAPEKQLASELFSHLEKAVRITWADQDASRVGCFLSGGTDSSSIAGFISRLTGHTATAFSVGFAEQRFNELSYARLAAKHFGLSLYEQILNSVETYDLVPKIVDLFDEPFGN